MLNEGLVQVTRLTLLVDVVCQLHVRAMFLMVLNLHELLPAKIAYSLLAALPLLAILSLHFLEHVT